MGSNPRCIPRNFFLVRYGSKHVQLRDSTGCKTIEKLSSSSNKHTHSQKGWKISHLLRKLPHFLQDGGNRPTPLPATCERNDAVAAHVVTASHDRPGEESAVLSKGAGRYGPTQGGHSSLGIYPLALNSLGNMLTQDQSEI